MTKLLSRGFLTRKHKSAVVLLFSLLLIQFYGLTASKVSANSSISTSTSVTQLWSFSTIGSVYTTPIVVNGYVYVNSYFDQAALGGIFCLNASTGTQVWNYITKVTTEGRPFSPVVADGRIYFNVQSGYLYCLDAYTGAYLWNLTNAGYGRSPAFVNGIAYVPSGDGNVYALDAASGAKIWKHTIGPAYGPLVVTGGYVYVTRRDDEGSSHGIIYCLDASTGDEHWKATIPEYVGSLVVSGGYAYISSYEVSYLGAEVVFTGNVYAFDASTGAKKWNYTTGSYQGNSPIVVPNVAGHLVYIGVGNKVCALDASNGTKIWNHTTEGSAGSPVLRDLCVYVGVNSKSEYGQASLYCLDASNGVRVWNLTTEPGNAASSPVVADDQVYVGNTGPQYFAHPDHYVYALNASTGEQIWNYTIEGNAGSLTVADGVVYVGSTFATSGNRDNEGNGAVYALKPITVTPSPPPSTIIVIIAVAVVSIAILAVLFLVYRIRRKGADKFATQHVVSKP